MNGSAKLWVLIACALASCTDDSSSSRITSSEEFDFGETTPAVTNFHFPLIPGTTRTELERQAGGDLVIVSRVGYFTAMIGGVETRPVYIDILDEGSLVGQRVEYYAQDGESNVWLLGADILEFLGPFPRPSPESWRFGERRGFEQYDNPDDIGCVDPNINTPPCLEPYLAFAGQNTLGRLYNIRTRYGDRRVEVVQIDGIVRSELGRFEDVLVLELSDPNEITFEIALETNFVVRDIGTVLLEGIDDAGLPTPLVDLLQVTSLSNPTILPDDFSDTIDNPFFPVAPGTTLVYQAMTEEGLQQLEVESTSEEEVVIGVSCRLRVTTETLDGELISQTREWFAQDGDGAVWRFGAELSYPDEEGMLQVEENESWIAGAFEAQPGIAMLGDPLLGLDYSQGLRRGVTQPIGIVTFDEATVTVPAGTFSDALEIFEVDDELPLPVLEEGEDPVPNPVVELPGGPLRIEPTGGGERLTYYGDGVGLVLTTDLRGTPIFELTEIR